MVTILEQTIKNPISFMGYMAGCCWNADVSDSEKIISEDWIAYLLTMEE